MSNEIENEQNIYFYVYFAAAVGDPYWFDFCSHNSITCSKSRCQHRYVYLILVYSIYFQILLFLRKLIYD